MHKTSSIVQGLTYSLSVLNSSCTAHWSSAMTTRQWQRTLFLSVVFADAQVQAS
jgi:hypothetical protein